MISWFSWMLLLNNTTATVILLIFISGFLKFISSWGHILSTLVALEFMALAIFMSMNFVTLNSWTELYNSFFYLAVAVSEGALGLSILVSITQKSGNDLMSSIYLITW